MSNEEIQNGLEEYEQEIFCLTDEDGNEIELENIDSVTYGEKEYLIMLSHEQEPPEVVILEVIPQENGLEQYVTVDNEQTLDAVYGIFKERYQDEVEFVD